MYPAAMSAPRADYVTQHVNAAAAAADIQRLLRDVFGSERDVNEWWMRPHPMLGGATPREVSVTSDGVARVRRLLVGLQHGFPV